MEFFKMRAV